MADDDVITETGKRVPRLKMTPSMLMDKTIVAYGPSKTGKTVITKAIMQVLNGHIEQILVIAPSEPSNRSYAGIVDPPLIHYRLYLPDPANPKKDDGSRGALRFMETIWKRQEMMASIYVRANNAEILSRLFGRIPRDAKREGLSYIEEINTKRTKVIEQARKQFAAEPGRREEKVKEINEKFKQMLVLLYKKYITPYYEELCAAPDLSEDEKYSLHYLAFNPRLLIIFDDCAAQLKPFFNKDIFRMLFYQNRHSFITAIVCCQDDTDLPTNLRKNAFISFFTERIVCSSNFERASNKFPKEVRSYVGEILGDVFHGHRKLAYIREDDRRQHFYAVEVPYPKPFHFCSAPLQELCASVQNNGMTMDKENPFYDKFKI